MVFNLFSPEIVFFSQKREISTLFSWISLSITALLFSRGSHNAVSHRSNSSAYKLSRLQHRLKQLRSLLTVCLIDSSYNPSGKGPQGPKVKDNKPFHWPDHVARLNDRSFKLRYRLTASGFYKLLGILKPDLSLSDPKQAARNRGSFDAYGQILDPGAVIPEVRLAVALRYFAGGDPLDLELIYHICHKEVYKSIWIVVDSINSRLKMEFPIDDIAKLQKLEAEFRAISRQGIWTGQVSAIDGIQFPTISPGKAVHNPLKYYCARKSTYAMLAIAICNASRRFQYYDISVTPTTHDSLAWSSSALGARFAAGDLPPQFHINGDNALRFLISCVLFVTVSSALSLACYSRPRR